MALLVPCTEQWGTSTIIDSDPAASIWSDVIYRPLRPDLFLDSDPDWGLYDQGGNLIEDGAYFRLPDYALVGQSLYISPPTKATRDEAAYLYGGPVIMHYGHFLTAALPRLWQAVRDGLRGRKVLVHSHWTPEDWFTRDYVRTTLGALGLGPADFVQFTSPTRVRRVEVPRPALQEQTYAHQVFRTLCRHIGAATGTTPRSRPVYLTKTRLGQGIYQLVNEAEIEAVMAAQGIEIVHPQELSLVEQIALLNGAPAILGTTGSAFHTSLFAQAPVRIIGLNYSAQMNANHALVDGLCHNQSTYLYPATGMEAIPGDTVTFCYRLENAAGIARELLEYL